MGTDQKTLNALAKGAGITAIGMFISKALTYLYRVSIARFVGPDAYGQLSLALMVVGIGSTLAYLSLGSALKKQIPEYRTRGDIGKIRGSVLSALQLSIPRSLVVAGTVFFGSKFISLNIFESRALIPLLKVMSVSIVASNLSKIFFDTTIGFNKVIYKTVTTKIIQNVVQVSVTVILLVMGFNVISAAWGWIAGAIVAAILGAYFMEYKVGPIIFSDSNTKYQHRNLLNFSLPLLLSGLVATVMGWADTGLLGYYMTDYNVGLYNAALPTAMLILIPHHAIGSLATSSFSELKERSSDSLEDSAKTATFWVFSLVFPTFLLMLFFSEEILLLLFGSEYTAASTALSILSVGYLVNASVGRVGSLMESKGHTRYFLFNNVIALSLNLVLNVMLIPPLGIVGASLATTSSLGLANIMMYAEVWRREKIITTSLNMIKIVFCGAIPLSTIAIVDILVFGNSSPLWAALPLGIIYNAIYLTLFLKIIGLREQEKEVVLRLGEITGNEEKARNYLRVLEKYGK